MPMKRIASTPPITTSVCAAFFDSGGLKAGTPVAIASVPVSATAPDANARSSRKTDDAAGRRRGRLHDLRRRQVVLAQHDDPVGADRDHREGAEHEQVGRDGEDVAGLAHAAEVARA